MATTPLSRTELATVVALAEAGRLDKVPADSRRAVAFMARAKDRLEQLALLTSDPVRYDVAYDAAHDVGEALLAGWAPERRDHHDQGGLNFSVTASSHAARALGLRVGVQSRMPGPRTYGTPVIMRYCQGPVSTMW